MPFRPLSSGFCAGHFGKISWVCGRLTWGGGQQEPAAASHMQAHEHCNGGRDRERVLETRSARPGDLCDMRGKGEGVWESLAGIFGDGLECSLGSLASSVACEAFEVSQAGIS